MKQRLSIPVVIPTKNEEKTIGKIIKGVKKYADEILVVDGHSQDKTQEIAQRLEIKTILDNKKGKGEALRLAIQKVTGEIIVFIDADGSHDPKDIPKLINPILKNKADLVIGSRARGGSDELQGDFNKLLRQLGSDIITLGINYRFRVRLTDSQNGFRAIRTSVAKQLNLKENITTIEQEIVIKTLKKGFRITEIPAHEYARQYGNSAIKLRKVSWRYFYSWLKYLFLD